MASEQDFAMKFTFTCNLGTTSCSYSCEEVIASEVIVHFIHFMQAAGFSMPVIADAAEAALQDFNCMAH